MQSVARNLTANLAVLQREEQAAEIQSVGRGNEHECLHCRDSGWQWIDLPGNAGMRQCECVAEKARMRALALIPKRFKESSFESFKPRDPKQQRALSLMRKDTRGSWYFIGA